MTHPTEEQWMAYLYGELDRKSQAALAGHLRSCPECRTQLTAWSDAKEGLDGWRLPESRTARTSLRPLVKWGVAAALLLAAGFAAGRLTSTRRADTLPGVSAESSAGSGLRPGSGTTRAAELAGLRADLREDVRKELAAWTEELVAATAAVSRHETLRLVAAFAETYELARWQDRQVLAQALGRLESQYVTQHAVLRNGLGVLAWATDEELQRVQQAVAEMSAGRASAQPDSDAQKVSLPSNTRSP